MPGFLSFIIFLLLGLIIGSFLNAVIYRLHRGISLSGRSFCPHCRHQLAAYDLVPLLSFAMLSGRCRYCGKKISWQYPAVEASCGLLFGLFGYIFAASASPGLSAGELFFALWFVSLLIVIFVFDLIHYLIPDLVVVIGAISALVYRLVSPTPSVMDGLAGAAIVGGFFAALYVFSHGQWLGFGDVKLGIFLGLLLGWQMGIVMLFLAYLAGAVVGVGLILLKRRTIKGTLPFGTFLTAATVAVMLFGDRLISWYLQHFY